MATQRTGAEARALFRRTFKGQPNFITPNVEAYGFAGRYAYEISSGRAIFGDGKIYGVSVLTETGERTDKGQSFRTRKEADDYVRELRADK